MASASQDLPEAPGTDRGADPWASFRVEPELERLRLLRQLRDGSVPVVISSPAGTTLCTTLWAVDAAQERLNFNAEQSSPQWDSLVESDEVVAVAYLDSVKLQFDLQALMLVHGAKASALQTALPQEIYRFQRRAAYRVRTAGRGEAQALMRHPSLPEMTLALRVLDVSIGGCALWLPADVPPLQAGTVIGEMTLDLDHDTRITSAIVLQHVSASGDSDRSDAGARLGCEWRHMSGTATRTLQRWIDQSQKRRRLLTRS